MTTTTRLTTSTTDDHTDDHTHPRGAPTGCPCMAARARPHPCQGTPPAGPRTGPRVVTRTTEHRRHPGDVRPTGAPDQTPRRPAAAPTTPHRTGHQRAGHRPVTTTAPTPHRDTGHLTVAPCGDTTITPRSA